MAGLPYDLRAYIAFDGTSVNALAPTWTDVTPYLLACETSRGRAYDTDTASAGRASLTLDNSDGRFDPDNASGPHFGFIRPNRRVKITVQQTQFTTPVTIFTGYIDSLTRTWPGGGSYSETKVEASDYFKLLAKRTNTGATVQETAALRIRAILLGVGAPTGLFDLNPGGYASRIVAKKTYAQENSLNAAQEVAFSDGGIFFVGGDGVMRFHPYAYRTSDIRSTASNGTFGNAPGAIAVEADLDPTLDDQLLANTIYVTGDNGAQVNAVDAAGVALDGPLEFDLGQTLLRQVDAEARADELLAKRKQAKSRYFSLTLEGHTGDDQMTQSLAREISDRITLSITPPGGGSTVTQAQFIESVSHSYEAAASFTTTWQLSPV